MHLHYFVKLKISVFFVKIPMLEKRNSKILIVDFDFTYRKMQLFDFDIMLWQI